MTVTAVEAVRRLVDEAVVGVTAVHDALDLAASEAINDGVPPRLLHDIEDVRSRAEALQREVTAIGETLAGLA